MSPDPRTKLLILALTSVSVFLNGSLVVECLFISIPLILCFLAGERKKPLRYALLFLALFLVQLVLIRHLPVAVGGILYMFAVYIRKLIPCFMLGYYLISTTKVSSFLAGIGRFRLPKGFTIALSITLRYFPAMGEEWRSIRDAMALRGICPSAKAMLLHPLRTMEYVYVPMLVSASRISDEISQAAITRGIDHVGERICLEEVRFTIRDYCIWLIYAGVIALMVMAPSLGVI